MLKSLVVNMVFYKWRYKYGGMQSSGIKRLIQLDAENSKPKQMYAQLGLATKLQQEIINKL